VGIWRQCAGCVGVPYRNMRGGAESVRRWRSRWGAVGLPAARGACLTRLAGLADRRTRTNCANRRWNRAIALLPDVGRRRSRGPRGGMGGSPACGAGYPRGQVGEWLGQTARAWLPGKHRWRVLTPFLFLCRPMRSTGMAPPARNADERGAVPSLRKEKLLSRPAWARRFVCHVGDR